MVRRRILATVLLLWLGAAIVVGIYWLTSSVTGVTGPGDPGFERVYRACAGEPFVEGEIPTLTCYADATMEYERRDHETAIWSLVATTGIAVLLAGLTLIWTAGNQRNGPSDDDSPSRT